MDRTRNEPDTERGHDQESTCTCGHVLDEHDDVGECTVVEHDGWKCPCFAFEEEA